MSLNRVLRYFNITVAVLLVFAVGAIYWLAYRPLPETSGQVALPVSAKVIIRRDALGIPHITAQTEEDALFAQGYVTAQDRLWQMDMLRRRAAGELAEIVGPSALALDRESRRLRLARLADEGVRALPEGDRAAIAAYARGINVFIESHRDRLPVEFTLLRYQPRVWRIADCVLVGLQMYRTLTTVWQTDLLKAKMLAGGDPAKVNFLFPVRSGEEVQIGSNAWVLGGRRTASGKPLLANDMHMEYSIPGIWYAVHLRAPGLNVSGVAAPGVPGVMVGHNDRIAWGVTSLQFDCQDLYVEELDDQTGRYRFRGQIEQARPERDIILVKGARPVEQTNWVTRHGPLWALDGKRRMSLRWTAAEFGVQLPFVELNRAGNWQQFRAALSRLPGPGTNFVYADVDGNIGMQTVGKLPIRKNFQGDVPLDGASGNFEWEGSIPFDELPSAFNPAGGMIVNANNNPFPVQYPYAVSGSFAAPYRANEIREFLGSRRNWRAGDMITVQKDVYSSYDRFLARQLIAAYDRQKRKDPALEPAISLLRNWNGQVDKDLAAPFLLALANQHIRKAIADSASHGNGAEYDFVMSSAVVARLLRERPAGWFANYDEVLLAKLADALDEGRRMRGRNLAKWRYGQYLEVAIAHPVGHHIPFLSKYFDIGPVPMSGSGTTIKQTTWRVGPSMRLAADPAAWDRSKLNLLTGESGQVLSRHYKDQWEAYYWARTLPMPFHKVDAAATLELIPVR